MCIFCLLSLWLCAFHVRVMKRRKHEKTVTNLSMSDKVLGAMDAYIEARGYGSRTSVVEEALAEFLQTKGYKIEPSAEEVLAALAKIKEAEASKTTKRKKH